MERIIEIADHGGPDGWHSYSFGEAREHIVRCGDCIYYERDKDPIDPGWPMMCGRTGQDMVEAYGFCAWGERRA